MTSQGLESESDEVLLVEPPSMFRSQRVKVAGAVGLVAALLLCFGAVAWHGASVPMAQSAQSDYSQLDEIVVKPPREKCSKVGSSCLSTKCCKMTGYNCFEKEPGTATCMKSCIPGVNGTCLMPDSLVPRKQAIGVPGTTLFCFTLYMEDTGSTKKFYDLSLLRTNLFLGSSLFGCEAYKVYSDVETWLSPGQVNTVKVNDVNGDFHFGKRKLTGTWINSPIFIQAWKAIRTEGLWASHDWTVKVDADTVFLPMRIRTRLSGQKVTSSGIYLENCKYVNYGFFGNLEVVSHQGFSTFLANLDDCVSALNWKGREKDTDMEPWGEDLLMQRCMDLHGVDKVEAFDLTTDSMCKAFRPKGQKKNAKWRPNCALTSTAGMHPFMKPFDYFECLKATQR